MSQEKIKNNKPTPAFLLSDYPYQASGEVITDLKTLQSEGVLHEIRCPECDMSIRAQGGKVKHTYERLMNGDGCIGCGNKNFEVRSIDMNTGE